MSDSVWKKEISFKRKPKADQADEPALPSVEEEAPKQSLLKKEISFGRSKAPKQPKEPKPEKQSFLKKEISFGKKAAEPAVAPVSETPLEPKAAGQSFLKKEISFSRKPKEPKELKAAQAPAEPKPEKQSFLKKEISLSRKKHDREVERLVQEAAQSVSPSFVPTDIAQAETAPTALAEAAVAAMVEADAAANAEPEPQPEAAPEQTPAFVEHAPVEPTFVEHEHVEPLPVEPVALAAVPDPEPVELHAVPPAVDAVEGADVYAVPVLPVDEAPAVPDVPAAPPLAPLSALSPAIVAASAPAAAPPPLEPAAVAPEPEAWHEPAAAAPPPAEPWLTEPELPPAPELPTAVVVHPPVPAADLPPLAPDGAKAPFWKKELSLSRKPKAEHAPKPASSTPFWKKELGRKKPQVAAEAAVPVDAPTETLPAVTAGPFWKKQLSFSKLSFSLPARPGGGKGSHGVKRLVGLKIGSSQIAAARVSNNGSAEVTQLAREVLAPGVVVGGELRDPEALSEALKSFFARNKLPRKGVRLGIASNRIGVRIFDIVGVSEEKQLANAIHFRAQETLPIPLDEAVLDYRVLDESTDAEGQSVKRVLLVVAYRELVDRYVSACRKAGITLAGIDLEAFALLRTLAAPEDRGSSAFVAVSIGYDRSTFAVSDGRVCEFTRVLEWGGSALNVALARVFDSTPSEVEAIKRGLSLDGTTAPPGLTQEQTAQALDAVRRQVQSFARELVSSLQFYQNQPGSLGIGEIVLTGGTTHLHGLAEELERLIGVHVRVGDPFARVKISKKVAAADQVGSLAVAIGLGIED